MRKVLYTIGLLLAFGALIIGLAQPAPALAAAATLTTKVTQTLGSVRFYPCAGEYIELRGDYLALFHVTFDPTGGTHVVGENISKGVHGVGLQSGTLFVGSESNRRTTNIFGAPGFETTYVDTFRLIGQGKTFDLL